MKQVISGGKGEDAVNTWFNCLMGGNHWYNTENIVYQVIPTGGTISKLFVNRTAAVAAGATATFTLVVNGVPSLLTCTIAAGQSAGSDIGNSIAVVAGNTVSIQYNSTGTPGSANVSWTTLFEGSIAGESICLASTAPHKAATKFFTLQGYGKGASTEDRTPLLMPIAGTFKSMYVQLSADPGTNPNAYTITLRKGGVDQALAVTVVADNTTGYNIINTVAVLANDLVNIAIAPVSTPSVTPINMAVGMVFVAATDGQSLIVGGYENTVAGTDGYWHLVTGGDQPLMEEVNAYSLLQACTLSKLTVNISAAPGADKSHQFDLRVNGADSGLTVTIAGTATNGADVTHTATITDGQTGDIHHTVPLGVPADTFGGHWAVVSSITSGWAHIVKVNGVAAASIAKISGVAVAAIAKVNGVAV